VAASWRQPERLQRSLKPAGGLAPRRHSKSDSNSSHSEPESAGFGLPRRRPWLSRFGLGFRSDSEVECRPLTRNSESTTVTRNVGGSGKASEWKCHSESWSQCRRGAAGGGGRRSERGHDLESIIIRPGNFKFTQRAQAASLTFIYQLTGRLRQDRRSDPTVGGPRRAAHGSEAPPLGAAGHVGLGRSPSQRPTVTARGPGLTPHAIGPPAP
jgi:hypothetical protein